MEPPPAEPSAEALERAVARVVVAQTARAQGFVGARASALDVLSSVLLRYLKEAGHLAHEAAEQAGRAQPALPDALRALGALGADVPRLMAQVQGCFDGALDEVPFAQPLARYPVRKRPRSAPSFRELGDAPPAHVPGWAPALPDAHTYRATPAHAPAPPDDRRVRLELAAQTVSAEGAMARLADRLAPGAPADYAVAAPGRWGGPLTGAGVYERRAAEQAAVLAAAPRDTPWLRRGGVLPRGGDAEKGAEGLAAAAPALAALLAAPPAPPAADADAAAAAADGAAAGADAPAAAAGWVTSADAPAGEAVRHLPAVDAFALDSAAIARAAARGVRGGARAPPARAFAALEGRARAPRDKLEDQARLEAILARDPHSAELLETMDDILGQA
jgi:hypothetical protein